MMTIILSIIFGFIGGIASVFFMRNKGLFAPKSEYDNLVDQFTAKFTELKNDIDSALFTDYDMLNSINESISKSDEFLKNIDSEWDEYRRWTLGAWNDMYHIKDSIEKQKNNTDKKNDQ